MVLNIGLDRPVEQVGSRTGGGCGSFYSRNQILENLLGTEALASLVTSTDSQSRRPPSSPVSSSLVLASPLFPFPWPLFAVTRFRWNHRLSLSRSSSFHRSHIQPPYSPSLASLCRVRSSPDQRRQTRYVAFPLSFERWCSLVFPQRKRMIEFVMTFTARF
ncbi:hypothetical protein PIB30_072352 [Stylosanthes scabra]|uniref:Uncharacterized protein n=1 Tax=Stylosanthes scabra TaxID=79078 RepID=A0ABU6TR67_9FABA|nr:hypothetical protein [Stylosanthes scabra]